MATMETDGLAGLILSMEELRNLPDSVTDAMVNAMADVIEPAQKAKGRAYKVHLTGVTLASIKRGKPTKTKDGKTISVYPQGTNADGNRNAEVAFINEFGKHGQPPRPFIRDANEENGENAVDAAEKVYNDHIDSIGL